MSPVFTESLINSLPESTKSRFSNYMHKKRNIDLLDNIHGDNTNKTVPIPAKGFGLELIKFEKSQKKVGFSLEQKIDTDTLIFEEFPAKSQENYKEETIIKPKNTLSPLQKTEPETRFTKNTAISSLNTSKIKSHTNSIHTSNQNSLYKNLLINNSNIDDSLQTLQENEKNKDNTTNVSRMKLNVEEELISKQLEEQINKIPVVERKKKRNNNESK